MSLIALLRLDDGHQPPLNQYFVITRCKAADRQDLRILYTYTISSTSIYLLMSGESTLNTHWFNTGLSPRLLILNNQALHICMYSLGHEELNGKISYMRRANVSRKCCSM